MLSTAQSKDQQYPTLSIDAQVDYRNSAFKAEGTLDASLTENKLFQKASPFYYNERARVTFLVSDQFKADFVMLKGLIEFHRPKDFVFNYDKGQKSIGVDLRRDQFAQLAQLLGMVYDSLVKEKAFRHALKMAIEFETRYRLERESVYAILRNSSLVTA